tara:strand:+ start:68 stop:1264 length:1197 start_codon:yes stop_codon:yes gene_type:complete
MPNNYDKRFSMPHWDAVIDDNFFLKCIEAASEQWRSEVYDIYFGSTFLHRDVTYGDTMGVNASPKQYKNLLKIQEKYGIPISLTLNEMNRPVGLLRPDVIKDFISFIKKYYDDGVRSCTISHTHLMRTGALQEAFPDMMWKNTVNHGIRTTQEMIDYAALGYDIINLDRKFNRNFLELKKAKKEADRLGIKLSLLITEYCMPECPFKVEHDCWEGGSELRRMEKSYWDIAENLSCNTWRVQAKEMGVINPRMGTDWVISSKDNWDEFANLVDIFKFSGRLNNLFSKSSSFKWCVEMFNKDGETNHLFVANDFKTIYDNNLMPFHMWRSTPIRGDYPAITNVKKIKEHLSNHFWNTEKAIVLAKVLKNCKNQCYNCHKCDELFGTGELDTVLKINLGRR